MLNMGAGCTGDQERVMRIGIFHGIDGDAAALGRALELTRDCDRVVSLGDLLGGTAEQDLACLARVAEDERVLVLAGKGERRRAADPHLPDELRSRLRALPPAAVESGVALIGSVIAESAPASRALGGAPRLVAPIEVAGTGQGMHVWRAAAGGLARVSELAGSVPLRSRNERLRIDVGAAGARGTCIVLDFERGTLELRGVASKRPPRRRRPAGKEGQPRQQLLAV
jgi:hypothetical protein